MLKDIDGTNEKEGDWVKINTVAHYTLKEGAQLKLTKKSGQDSSAVGTNIYHLEKKAENDPDQKIAPSEVFFTRMMTMREVIHPQVDALFEAIFNMREAPPLSIKILFDFLDRTAKEVRNSLQRFPQFCIDAKLFTIISSTLKTLRRSTSGRTTALPSASGST